MISTLKRFLCELFKRNINPYNDKFMNSYTYFNLKKDKDPLEIISIKVYERGIKMKDTTLGSHYLIKIQVLLSDI